MEMRSSSAPPQDRRPERTRAPFGYDMPMDGASAQIDPLLDIIREVLAENLRAVYLYGSAVMGGLRPDSDLDVMVVIEHPTTPAQKRELVTRILEISMKPRPIELTTVVEGEIRPWTYPPRRDFQYGQWWRSEYQRGNFEPWTSDVDPDLTSLIKMVLLVNEVLEGPPAHTIFEPVPRLDHVRAQVDALDGLLDDLDGDERNVVLTLARIWCSLVTDEIRSKDAAAEWLMDRLPTTHRSLLGEARSDYLGEGNLQGADLTARARTFADYAVTQIKELSAAELERADG